MAGLEDAGKSLATLLRAAKLTRLLLWAPAARGGPPSCKPTRLFAGSTPAFPTYHGRNACQRDARRGSQQNRPQPTARLPLRDAMDRDQIGSRTAAGSGARTRPAPRRRRRGEGRPRGGEGGDARRDRRVFRRPGGEAGAAAPGQAEGRPGGEQGGAGRPARRAAPARGKVRRPDAPPPEREGGGERRWSGPRAPQDYRPYLSPLFQSSRSIPRTPGSRRW